MSTVPASPAAPAIPPKSPVLKDYAVTCRAEGNAVDPNTLGTQLVTLLKKLTEFGPIGRIKNDGTWYQATLVVTAENETEARRIAQSAIMMAASSVGLPNWPLQTIDVFELSAT
jgi:hypothetical protein